MDICCSENIDQEGPATSSRDAGNPVRKRRTARTVIAIATACGMLAAGCATAGNPAGGTLPGASGSFLDSAGSGPGLIPTAEPAPADQPREAFDREGGPADDVRLAAVRTGSAAAAAPAPTIPVTVEGAVPAPEGGHPPAPQAAMIPRQHPYWNYPSCAPGPPRRSDCYPPTEWETPQDLSDCWVPVAEAGVGGICASDRVDEIPRWTTDIVRWVSWCHNQPSGNCGWLLFEMKWALDYLGAHPWCVLNEYQDRVDAYTAGQSGVGVMDRHGWHNCATVIDPLADGTPEGLRRNDAGLLLSDTVSLAEQCRIVLPPDVRLETGARLFSDEPDQRFGSDCDAWAQWVLNRPKGRDRRNCDRSARLAEEWMEHHHLTPERYFPVHC